MIGTPAGDVGNLGYIQMLSQGGSRGLSPAQARLRRPPGLPEDEVLLDAGSGLAKADDHVAGSTRPGQAPGSPGPGP